MSAVVLALVATVGLPPPLCRGRVFTGYEPRLDAAPSPRAVAEVQTAYDLLCPDKRCGTGVVYQNQTIGMNAVTWVSGLRDGSATQAKIVYSPDFLNALDKSFGPGASFGVLAHEVGHHLTAARSLRQTFEHSWNEELRADYLAGCALGKSGRTSQELEAALAALASVATSSHPSFHNRNPVVRRGFDECRKAQAEADRKAADEAFGIGAVLTRETRSRGCWHFWFRPVDDVKRVGPVAAKRRRSQHYASGADCKAAAGRMKAEETGIAEECTCEDD